MNLFEFFSEDPYGYRDEKQDNTVLDKKSPRKTRLTLEQIHRLRIMNDVRRIEHEKDIDKISNQYAPPEPAGGAPPFM
jgi:hypothetical protein